MAGVADWGVAQVGRLTLREGFTLTASMNGTTGNRTLTLTGEESSPPLTLAQVAQRQEDILGLQSRFLPITFTNKDDHNGWYLINDVDSNVTNWTDEVVKFSWQIQAVRIGAQDVVEIESRLTGVARVNNFGLTGERWHAPAASAYGYYTGTSQPSGSVSRASADGTALTVYRGIPASVSPRWGVSLANYQQGRARVLVNTIERTATDVVIGASATWELNNGLVRVTPGVGASATLSVSSWSGSAWQGVDWNASITASASGAVTSWDSVSIIRNDYELVTLRLVKNRAPGLANLDLSLRRGSRTVETYLQTDTATILSWYRAVTEAGTAPVSAGYVSATANDGAGNRYIVGSAKTFTAQTGVGGITASATRTLDAFIGSVVGGSAAAAGDAAAVLTSQYLVQMSDTTMGAPR